MKRFTRRALLGTGAASVFGVLASQSVSRHPKYRLHVEPDSARSNFHGDGSTGTWEWKADCEAVTMTTGTKTYVSFQIQYELIDHDGNVLVERTHDVKDMKTNVPQTVIANFQLESNVLEQVSDYRISGVSLLNPVDNAKMSLNIDQPD